MINEIRAAKEYVENKGVGNPEIAIILGTGLGLLVDEMDVEVSISYAEIPYFPEAAGSFHNGRLIYGNLSGKKVLVMHGRFHYYEGYSLQHITFPVRVMQALGIKTLLVSNACGTVNLDYKPASLMIIDDHINMLPGNPLIGSNDSKLGPRFVDMSEPYDRQLIEKMQDIARKNKISINKGVYVAWTGPSLETRAEYRFIKIMGADVVGMSSVPEVIVARHMGMKVAAVSVITDSCNPDNLQPIDIDDILNNAAIAERDLIIIFKELVRQI
ncbi:MAG: purine-nucleoside phosphorylase [Bacteroidetes bacterium]|nr:purine-nucleoside phosphorylase [Bacteroidota bacterium]